MTVSYNFDQIQNHAQLEYHSITCEILDMSELVLEVVKLQVMAEHHPKCRI